MCFKRACDKAVRRTMTTACHRSSTGDHVNFGLRVSHLLHCENRLIRRKIQPRRSRLAEGDPAVGAQGELLPPQHDLLVALDGDEGAVRAVVGEDEFVEPTL